MSDPAVAAGKCGKGYLAGIAFTYNEGSQMQVHSVQDMNDSDVLHTWDWKRIAPVSDCNNSSGDASWTSPPSPPGRLSCRRQAAVT